jgi:hypothetical protein
MEAQRSSRRSPRLPYFRDGGVHFVERRTQGGIEALARVGEVSAPRGPAHERYAEPSLQSAHRLTDGRVGYAEAIPGSPKSLRFRYRNEGDHAIKFVGHR